MIDFLAVLFGIAISEERTLEAFYERLQPFALPSWSYLNVNDSQPVRPSHAFPISITLFGVPEDFAAFLRLKVA